MTRTIETRGPAVGGAISGGRLITNLAFEPGGVTIEFVSVGDVKRNGVMLGQSLYVPHADQYDDEIDGLLDAAHVLLADVLEDFDAMVVYEPPAGDEDLGMGE